jgi:hypothetical protein
VTVGDYSENMELCLQVGQGDGTFQAGACTSAGDVVAIQVADLNGDGRDDLLVAGQSPNTLSAWVAGSGGTFTIHTYPLPYSPSSIAAGDFNGDGKTDVAIVSQGVGVSVLLGSGDGTFQPTPIEDFMGQPGAWPSLVGSPT